MRGDCGVAGEGRLVGVPKFHFSAKFTMPLTNITSDWMSSTFSGLCIILNIGSLSCLLGCNKMVCSSYYRTHVDLVSCLLCAGWLSDDSWQRISVLSLQR